MRQRSLLYSLSVLDNMSVLFSLQQERAYCRTATAGSDNGERGRES